MDYFVCMAHIIKYVTVRHDINLRNSSDFFDYAIEFIIINNSNNSEKYNISRRNL